MVWVSAEESRAQTVAGTLGPVACAAETNPGDNNIDAPRMTEPSVEVKALRDVGNTRMDEPFAVGEETSRQHARAHGEL